MKILTKEEIKTPKKSHNLTFKDLKRFVEENSNLHDDTLVLIERIEDVYFQKYGWKVYLHEGWQYHQALRWNQQMLEEIERRKQNLEPEYKFEDPSSRMQEITDDLKDQFHTGHCISRTKDDIILIYSHY